MLGIAIITTGTRMKIATIASGMAKITIRRDIAITGNYVAGIRTLTGIGGMRMTGITTTIAIDRVR